MIEQIVLRNLIRNEDYARRVLPFLKDDYFQEDTDRILFRESKDFIVKYNDLPSKEAIYALTDELKDVNDEQVRTIKASVDGVFAEEIDSNLDWLIDTTEKFCQDKAIYLAIMKSIQVINDGEGGSLSKGAIPSLLQEALAVSFDPNIGHDYLEEFDERFEHYHRVENKFPFDLAYFNRITNKGFAKKTLNVILAGTGVGKSLAMCHMAAAALNQGKNVLYITLELAEEEVAKRIDANLMNITIDQLMLLHKDDYTRKASALKNKTNGKLIIKEYPTASASPLHFKNLLNELYLKKSFKPDIIFIDYINLCLSMRLKMGANVNSYTYIKVIAEELRGLAVEYDVPIVTATQVNRAGFNSSDVDITDTSESFGLPATADLMFALIATEDLDRLGQIMVKQLKNRYTDKTKCLRFVVGVDRAKMKLFDVEDAAQTLSQVPTTKVERPITSKFAKLKV